MAAAFPYTYVACPCTSLTSSAAPTTAQRRSSRQLSVDAPAEDKDDTTFNPHDQRASFSLYPYDHLLYCDECHQIRCPRCCSEEIVNWYCPSCLFEVPSSLVKSDGNRCTRNCYNCPTCTAPLSINGLDQQSKDHLAPQDASQPGGPFFLSCPYCDWSSLDVGIEFSKPTKITEQLTKLRTKNTASTQIRPGLSSRQSSLSLHESSAPEKSPGQAQAEPQTHDEKFASLSNFFKAQLADAAGASSNPYADSSYGSPNNLARIMSLYGGLNHAALKKSREKPQPMREALTPLEGLQLLSISSHEEAIEKLRLEGYASTTSMEQRQSHPYNTSAHFNSDLWPVATLLRTRRSKRCRTCRHILTKPEAKIGSTRYKIRLLAQNNIPRLALCLFAPNSAGTPQPSSAFALTSAALTEQTPSPLRPNLPVQFLLTLTNPLFDAVRVTLATPATTPGAAASRVTILCPSFEIGPAGDLWDEALGSQQPGSSSRRPGTATSTTKDPSSTAQGDEQRQPEAGKVWERGRNWTSVVVEVVPGAVVPAARKGEKHVPAASDEGGDEDEDVDGNGNPPVDGQRPGVDEDVLEIPVFVRVEWEAEVTAEDAAATGAAKGAKESRELAFWSVLGAGRIAV